MTRSRRPSGAPSAWSSSPGWSTAITTSADYLGARGWLVTAVPTSELFARNGLQPPAQNDYDPLGEIIYVSARLPASS